MVALMRLTAQAAPRLPLGPRADGAHDRAAHAGGGLRGGRGGRPGDPEKLLDELGDLLFQTAFLALLLSEQGEGDWAASRAAITAKLIRRHPHVFGETVADTPGQVRRSWEQIKSDQEGRRASSTMSRRCCRRCCTRARCSAGRRRSGSTGTPGTVPGAIWRTSCGSCARRWTRPAPQRPSTSRTRTWCTSWATCCSRASTSPGWPASIPSWRCAPRPARFRDAGGAGRAAGRGRRPRVRRAHPRAAGRLVSPGQAGSGAWLTTRPLLARSAGVRDRGARCRPRHLLRGAERSGGDHRAGRRRLPRPPRGAARDGAGTPTSSATTGRRARGRRWRYTGPETPRRPA